jgi:hypothetical protein
MIITYSKRLKGYLATISRQGGKSLIAVKPTRLEAITTALNRLALLKYN